MDERRQFPRLLTQFQIFLLHEGGLIGAGTGYDLSAGGCAVAGQVNVGTGDQVALQLYLPDHEDPTTPLTVEVAVVRWIDQKKFALDFISLSSRDQRRLCRYVTIH